MCAAIAASKTNDYLVTELRMAKGLGEGGRLGAVKRA